MEGTSDMNPNSPVHASSSRSAHEYVDLDGDGDLPPSNEPSNLNCDEHASVGVENEENRNEEDEEESKHKRKKTSSVWEEFVVVTLKNGLQKVECIHCKGQLTKVKSGTTTTYKRHLLSCLQRKQYQRTQQMLNFQPEAKFECEKSPLLISPNAKYDDNKMREAIASWIMGTEQPFNVVEDDLYVYMMKTANPLFEKVSRVTTKADCIKVYDHEKKRLKALIDNTSTISLTTDCWRSSHQRIEYMVITGHFIDHKWRLQKRVLNFVHVPPPRTGLDIANGIYNCLIEWGIEDKVFSISVDNASYNDRVVETLKRNFSLVRKLPCNGRLVHVRCCAHILNICVKYGLSKIDGVIEEVREAVKYINYSEARRQTFANVAHQLKVRDRKLMIDVATRWNSTYDMLSLALKFKDVFPSYAEYEPKFNHLPSKQDWENVTNVCEILKVFKVCTNIISGSHYPTANLYLIQVYKVKQVLDNAARSEDWFVRDMVGAMKEKFDKYWGECNLLMAIASVLDPRFKKWLLEMSYRILYTPDQAIKNIKEVEDALEDMYKDYKEMHDALVKEVSANKIGSFKGCNRERSSEGASNGSGWEEYEKYIKEVDLQKPQLSELKMYYDEGLYIMQGGMDSFNVLEWWNIHKLKFPVLSKMARDVLAIPISTVASEATFSAGGRVIEPYRSALAPETVQMLICGEDWIRQTLGLKKKVKEELPIEIILPDVKQSN